MSEIIHKALTAKRESKHIEFKSGLDVGIAREWCAVIKDIVAMANSGGGVIVFGLDSCGQPSGTSIEALAKVDPADVGNKISKYTGSTELELEIRVLTKEKINLVAFLIHGCAIPIIFEKPGTYDVGGGRQQSEFSAGIVYFRHGAKSEAGNSDDIRRVIERQLEFIRKSWLKGVRKVVQAPRGTQIVAVTPSKTALSAGYFPSVIRAVSDPNATPVLLTRDPSRAKGVFVHEEISDGLFDEINNVVDANRILSKGQPHFFFGAPVYFRIYAERQHVKQSDADLLVLLRSAVLDFYAPHLYWLLALPPTLSSKVFADLYLQPKNPHVHYLMRIAILLGVDFSKWLFDRWARKWGKLPQPPRFYWTFKEILKKIELDDHILLASRLTPAASFRTDNSKEILAKELAGEPAQARTLLSAACLKVFEGKHSARSTARNLDYLAYGHAVMEKSSAFVTSFMNLVGDRMPGDVIDTNEQE